MLHDISINELSICMISRYATNLLWLRVIYYLYHVPSRLRPVIFILPSCEMILSLKMSLIMLDTSKRCWIWIGPSEKIEMIYVQICIYRMTVPPWYWIFMKTAWLMYVWLCLDQNFLTCWRPKTVHCGVWFVVMCLCPSECKAISWGSVLLFPNVIG